MTEVPPRLYGILATGAPVVAVFRRGPSAWTRLRGRAFPRRSDLSPDGRHLVSFIHKVILPGEPGESIFIKIAK